MRKYLFSGAIIAAVIGAIGLVTRTLAGPRNLQVLLSWIGWAVGMTAAILAVKDESAETSEYFELRDSERAAKRRR